MCAIIKKFIWEPFKASPVTCLVRLITAGFLGYVLYDGIGKISFYYCPLKLIESEKRKG